MISFGKLYEVMELMRADNQHFSYPFIVQLPNGEKVIAWFAYKVFGKDSDSLVSRVGPVYVVDVNGKTKQMDIIFDVPITLSEEEKASSLEYMHALEMLYKNFSRDKMDSLFRDHAYRPLYPAYLQARDFVWATRAK